MVSAPRAAARRRGGAADQPVKSMARSKEFSSCPCGRAARRGAQFVRGLPDRPTPRAREAQRTSAQQREEKEVQTGGGRNAAM